MMFKGPFEHKPFYDTVILSVPRQWSWEARRQALACFGKIMICENAMDYVELSMEL